MRIGDKVRIKEKCELLNELDPKLEHTVIRWGKGRVQLSGNQKGLEYKIQHWVYFKDIVEVIKTPRQEKLRVGDKVTVTCESGYTHYLNMDKVHEVINIGRKRYGGIGRLLTIRGQHVDTSKEVEQKVIITDITKIPEQPKQVEEEIPIRPLREGDKVMVANVEYPTHYLDVGEVHTLLETPMGSQTYVLIRGASRHGSGNTISQTVPLQEVFKV